MKVLSVFGTRPEAIKMCPLIKMMEENSEIESIVCLTGQHREMLQQVLDIFNVKADYNLDIMKKGQTLTSITSDILVGLEQIFKEETPDLVLVHGDTTTSFAAALAAFYQQLPVGHVEAGLRTYDKYSPFPEELNRNLTGKIAELHFAPTKQNAENLRKENIHQNVYITGNTVIDSMQTTIREKYVFHNSKLNNYDYEQKRIILLTAHRRENWGKPHENIFSAVKDILEKHSDVEVIYPVHPNPIVKNMADDVTLDGIIEADETFFAISYKGNHSARFFEAFLVRKTNFFKRLALCTKFKSVMMQVSYLIKLQIIHHYSPLARFSIM